MFKCEICGENFEELLKHLHQEKQEENTVFLGRSNVKIDHLEKYDKIKESCHQAIYKSNKYADEKCFCEGRIKITYLSDVIFAECERCKTLWLEID